MSRTKVSLVGTLRYSEADGLKYSVRLGKNGEGNAIWLEALSDWDHWPGLGKYPEKPKPADRPTWKERQADPQAVERWTAANKEVEDEWKRASEAFLSALHADLLYKDKAQEMINLQKREPLYLFSVSSKPLRTFWVYREKVLSLESTDPEVIYQKQDSGLKITDKAILLIKHFVLRQERQYERVRREVEALENMEKLEGVLREPIPDSVRLFVWQRDKGECVKCGSREKLEFDHIIPVTSGGSNTERNIQLLCERCNRSKGATI